jgi:hypothetical protein
MVIAILLSHLFGDYILQWDSLSRWKSQALGGVLVHGAIVIAITWLFSLPSLTLLNRFCMSALPPVVL